MPTLSTFFGLVIRLYYDDHPPPHFHVYAGEFSATVSIENPQLLEGHLPPKALAMATRWATLHHEELRHNWWLAENHHPLKPIPPLT